MTDAPEVAVLGAGVCGLYAARVLARAGARVTVLEQDEVVGGLAAGRERNGNYYDFGVHQLHAFDEEIFADIAQLMGDRLIGVQKLALIRYGDGYRRYPLEFFDLLHGIPPWTLAISIVGLGVQLLANRLHSSEPRNAEEALVQLYGRPLYEHFFRDFTHRYWGIPPVGLSASFVRRKMPRLSAVDVLKRSLSRLGIGEPRGTAVESALAEEVLYYSRTGAREMPMALARRIESLGGRVLTESPVVGLETDGERVTAVLFQRHGTVGRLPCDYCISTMPVPEMVRRLDPAPPKAVLDACNGLRYMALAVYGFLVRRPRVLDALYVYYRDRIFHRLAEPKNSGMLVTPADHTIILAETTCHVGDERWAGSASTVAQIEGDMEAEGLLRRDDIVETHVFVNAHAYPVFELGFERHHDVIMNHVQGFVNLWSTGREGAFAYPNMHAAMRMGADAAKEVVARWRAQDRHSGPAAAVRYNHSCLLGESVEEGGP